MGVPLKSSLFALLALAAVQGNAQDTPPQAPPATAVATGNELATKLAALQEEFKQRTKANDEALEKARQDLKDFQAKLANDKQTDREALGDLKNQVTTLAKVLSTLEEKQLKRQQESRRQELIIMRTRLESIARCVGFIGSYARGIGDSAETASLELRFGSFSNISSISPTFVEKVRKLGKNIPSLDNLSGIAGGLGSNPLFAVGIGLVNLILPKRKPQVISDVEDILSVSDALVLHRELTAGTSTRFASVGSAAKGVQTSAVEFFDALQTTFPSPTRPNLPDASFVSRTQRTQEILTLEFARIEEELNKLSGDQTADKSSADPEGSLVLLRGKVEALQRKASALLGLFKPMVGDLKRAWDYQADNVETIQKGLDRTILPGEDAKKTAKSELRARLGDWAKEAKDRAAKVVTDYDAEVKALESLIVG